MEMYSNVLKVIKLKTTPEEIIYNFTVCACMLNCIIVLSNQLLPTSSFLGEKKFWISICLPYKPFLKFLQFFWNFSSFLFLEDFLVRAFLFSQSSGNHVLPSLWEMRKIKRCVFPMQLNYLQKPICSTKKRTKNGKRWKKKRRAIMCISNLLIYLQEQNILSSFQKKIEETFFFGK